jgi:hypothetical protein
MLTDADVYGQSEDFEESNYDRLVRKWGGKAEFEVLNLLALLVQKYILTRRTSQAQKKRHALKERGQEVSVSLFSFFFPPLLFV